METYFSVLEAGESKIKFLKILGFDEVSACFLMATFYLTWPLLGAWVERYLSSSPYKVNLI